MARLFIALPIPERSYPPLLTASQQYPEYVKSTVPTERWHMTILFLGEVANPKEYIPRLCKPLIQTYLPTVNVTHAGRGLQRLHLWAWVTPTPVLEHIRQELIARLKKMRFRFPPGALDKEFVPHIHLANFWPVSRGLGLADYPAATSFATPVAHIYSSLATPQGVQYSREGSIPLTP